MIIEQNSEDAALKGKSANTIFGEVRRGTALVELMIAVM